MGRRFIIKIDHKRLKFLLHQRTRQESQHPWIAKLVGYDYLVEYKKGVENKAADALSRSMSYVDEEITCKGLTMVIPLWLERIKAAMKDSPYYLQLKKLEQKSISADHYKEVDGVWFYKGRIMS